MGIVEKATISQLDCSPSKAPTRSDVIETGAKRKCLVVLFVLRAFNLRYKKLK